MHRSAWHHVCPGEPRPCQPSEGSASRKTNKPLAIWYMVMSCFLADASVKLRRELLNNIPDILSNCEWSLSEPIPPITNRHYMSSHVHTASSQTHIEDYRWNKTQNNECECDNKTIPLTVANYQIVPAMVEIGFKSWTEVKEVIPSRRTERSSTVPAPL